MENEITKDIKKENCCNKKHGDVCGGTIYGLGFIGAAVYFIGHATTFWLGALGLLKAIIWPAFIVYKFLEFFHL